MRVPFEISIVLFIYYYYYCHYYYYHYYHYYYNSTTAQTQFLDSGARSRAPTQKRDRGPRPRQGKERQNHILI